MMKLKPIITVKQRREAIHGGFAVVTSVFKPLFLNNPFKDENKTRY